MSSMIGNILKVSLFGESHGECVGMTINGFPSGIKIPFDLIKEELLKRKSLKEISTSRQEDDEVEFISGVFNGVTSGAPITFIIKNKNVDSSKYQEGLIRPSHADLTSYLKYEGHNDYRGGGYFSGRLTVAISVLGALCKDLLNKNKIIIGSHIKQIANVNDFSFDYNDLEKQLCELNKMTFPVIDEIVRDEMISIIKKTKENGDSIGGILQVCVKGVPACLGEPYFDGIDSYVSSLLFSIGGVKGVIFGDENKTIGLGSEYNDNLRYEENNIKYLSNNCGGVLGGLTTGEPLIVNVYVKPTPSIFKNQKSINVKTKENIDLLIKGRHDPCIVHRVRSAVESLIAFAIVDLMMLKNASKW